MGPCLVHESGRAYARDSNTKVPLVIQIQDLIDGPEQTGRIVLRNNLFHNQKGNDEHIDVNSINGVVIQDKVFFDENLGSAPNETSSYICIYGDVRVVRAVLAGPEGGGEP